MPQGKPSSSRELSICSSLRSSPPVSFTATPSLSAFNRFPAISSRGPSGFAVPGLHRLEERGWHDAEWKDTDTGREAKCYTLTRKGRKQGQTEMLHWEQLSDAVALILRTAE